VPINTSSFIGQPYEDVRAQLEVLGLTVTRAEASGSLLADLGRELDADAVAGSDPADTTVPAGSSVTLFVAGEGYSPDDGDDDGGATTQPTQQQTTTTTTTTRSSTTTRSTTTSSVPVPAPDEGNDDSGNQPDPDPDPGAEPPADQPGEPVPPATTTATVSGGSAGAADVQDGTP
jgi:serine/threonine-protein kinase